MDSQIEKFFANLLGKCQNLEGKIVGKEMEPCKLRLGKDNRDAIIKGIVSRYKKGESIDFKNEELKKYKITREDFIRELTFQEIEKLFESTK